MIFALLLSISDGVFSQGTHTKTLPLAEKLNRLKELENMLTSQRITSDFASFGTPDFHGTNVGGGNGMNYYSGTYRHSIDLANGVSLTYNNNGISVGQTASWVGLGWNLSTGGKITRNVRGYPDDLGVGTYVLDDFDNMVFFQGWIRGNANSPAPCEIVNSFDVNSSEYTRSGDLEYFTSNILPDNPPQTITKKDSEPDLFSFSYPGGHGSFVFSSEAVSPQDPRKRIKTLVFDESRITYEIDPYFDITKFTIVDRTGTTYIFDIPERINTNSGVFPEDPMRAACYFLNYPNFQSGTFSNLSAIHTDYIQSWYLHTIILPDKSEITFEYDDEHILLERNFYANYRNYDSADEEVLSEMVRNFPFDGYPTSILQTKRLKRIYSDDSEIDFIANTVRDDLYTEGIDDALLPRSLDKIKVYSKIGSEKVLEKQIDFVYSYFDSQYSTNPTESNKGYGIFTLGEYNYGEYIYKRLKLDEIYIYNGLELLPPYKFDYVKDDDENYWLPARYSYCQDAYGFFNSNNEENSLVPKVWVYKNRTGQYRFSIYPLDANSPDYSYPSILDGADRRPSSRVEDVSIGMLEKIVYPTGGCMRIEYEQNDFVIDNVPANTFHGNGVRVSKISLGTEDAIGTTTEYKYITDEPGNLSSGKMIAMPQFGHLDPNNTDCESFFHDAGNQYAYWSGDDFNQYYIRGTHPENDMSEGISGYSRVEQTGDDVDGKTVYTFVNEATYNSHDPANILYSAYQLTPSFATPSRADYNFSTSYIGQSVPVHISETETGLYFNNGSYPYPPNTNYSWHRGKPLAKEVFDINDNLVLSESNDYNIFYDRHGQGSGEIVFGLQNGFLRNNVPPKDGGCGNTSEVYDYLIQPVTVSAKYAIHTGVDSYISTKHKTYEPQAGHPINETTHYEHNAFGLLSAESFTDEMGNIITTEYLYPCDLWDPDVERPTNLENDLTACFFNAIENNRHAIPIQALTYKQTNSSSPKFVLRAVYNKYKSLDVGVNQTLEVLAETYSIKTPGILLSEIAPPKVEVNSVSNYELTFDSIHFRTDITFSRYNPKGLSTEILENRGNPSAVIYALDNLTPVFEVSNAYLSEIEYQGFENHESYGWTVTSGCNKSGQYSKSGIKSLSIPQNDQISRYVGFDYYPTGEGYQASVWVKGTGNLRLTLNFNNSTIVKSTESNACPDWKLLTVSVSREELDAQNIQHVDLLISLQNLGSGNMFVDDVLFVPDDAFYQALVYDNRLRLISNFDVNNYYSSFVYDDFNRLIYTKDNDENILEANEYFTGNPSNFVWYPQNPEDTEIQAMETISFVANLKTGTNSYFVYGDGTSSLPLTNGLANHVYENPGEYTITLHVTTSEGYHYSTDRIIKVLPQ